MLTAHRARHVPGALVTITINAGEVAEAGRAAQGCCTGHLCMFGAPHAYRPVWRYAAGGWRRASAGACVARGGPSCPLICPPCYVRAACALGRIFRTCGMRTVACAPWCAYTLRLYGHAARYLYAARRCDGLPSVWDVLCRYVVSIGSINSYIKVMSSSSAPELRSDACAKSYFSTCSAPARRWLDSRSVAARDYGVRRNAVKPRG